MPCDNATVAIVCNSASATYHFRSDYIRSLMALGHTVHCISLSEHKSGAELAALCNGRSLILRSVLDFRGWFQICQALRQVGVVHAFTHPANLFSLLVARRTQTIVCTVTGMGRLWCMNGALGVIGRQCLMSAYRFLLWRAKAIIFQNTEDRKLFEQKILNQFHCRRVRIYKTSGSGVNVQECQLFANNKDRRSGKLKIGFFSRADALKGVGVFYEIAAKLGKRHLFVHAGHAGEGQYAADKIRATAAANNVIYLGVLKNPLPEIADCDLLLLPTTYREGVPRLLLECFALGVPTICYAGPGISEHVVHDLNSYIAFDAAEMADIIESATSEKLSRLSHEQRAYAARCFSVDGVTEIYLQALQLK